MDLILGSWAADNLDSLSEEELLQFEDVLEWDTLELFYYVQGAKQPPAVCDW